MGSVRKARPLTNPLTNPLTKPLTNPLTKPLTKFVYTDMEINVKDITYYEYAKRI